MADVTLNPTNPIPDPTVGFPHEEPVFQLPDEIQAPDPFAGKAEREPLELEDLRQTANDMNAAMEALNQRYRFGIYQDTDQFYVQVLDSSSGRTLRTRPVQDLLELRRRLQDMVGLVVDEEL